MPLLTVDQVRARITTALDDTALGQVITDEEAELIRQFGAHGDGVTAVSEPFDAAGDLIFLARPAASITSISVVAYVGASAQTLDTSQYVFTAGRSDISVIRLRAGVSGTVTYVPADDQALRRQVLIELIRIAVSQEAFKQESFEGFEDSYSYVAPDWQQSRAQQYARLSMSPL